MAEAGPVGAAYAGCRERIGALVIALDDAGTKARVSACPKWSVHDVVAHVCGVVDDALAGRLDGVATDPWTAAQVEARRNLPVADIVAEWNEKAPAFESMLDGIGITGMQAVFDVVTHEHDVRGALGQPGARDSDAVQIGLEFVAPGYISSAAAGGLSVRVNIDGGPSFGESAQPDVSLTAGTFDVLRMLAGRRSVEQARALAWQGDVDRAIDALTFGPFTPASSAIDE